MSELHELYRELLSSIDFESEIDIQEDQTCCTVFYDNSNIGVEIEISKDSDLLLLNRKMAELPSDSNLRTARMLQILAVNGCQDKLCGSWFCIDPEGINIHLMAGYPIRLITPIEFNNLLFNFISIATNLEKEMNEEMLEMNSSTPEVTEMLV
ncbi:MAG: hypothetical protein KAG53_11405 [Endozoicomonadaceae bacterium]|nr:hypothetical protein [Endozoicomonadaceae bacterium]